ncbi:MAG TPA: sigma 54-interacting transcriptional regulator [Terriglobia bacterium]|nr:sigma 54-interacting transcriptional regulator [Terriglobia bacterium]
MSGPQPVIPEFHSGGPELFEKLFESSPDGIVLTAQDGEIVRVNEQVERLFGYGRGELLGQAVEILIPRRFHGAHPAHRRAYVAEPHTRPMGAGLELFGRRKDGTEFPVDIMLSPVETSAGPFVLGVVRDISDRKLAMEAVRQSEHRLQGIIDNSTAIIYLKDIQGRFLKVNRQFEYLFGIKRDEALGKTDHDLFPWAMADKFRANDQKVLQGGVPLEFEEVAPLGGGLRTYLSMKFPLFDAEGRPNAVAGISTDITERKQAEESLLLEVTSVLMSNLEIRNLFGAIAASIRRVKPHFYSTLALHDPPSNQLRLHVLTAPNPIALAQNEVMIQIESSPAGRAFTSGEPLVMNRMEAGHFDTEVMRRLDEMGVKSGCWLPLSSRDRMLGALVVTSEQPDDFSEKDVRILSQVANQVAMTLENALSMRLIAEMKQRLTEEKLYLEEELRTEYNFEEIVGESPDLKRVLKQVETVAPTDATVLILGETGTGKELVARAIHHLSSRRERTFVKLNCAAIPGGLLESELFGHERGAFTGAISQKIGRLELAHQGTLFLDEVGDIPLDLQPKLLRALQEKEFERLGSNRTIPIDVRLIAATNRDLAQMMEDRQFRSDLYYRLRVFPVTVPPLRERAGDVEILVRYFTQKHAQRMGKRIEVIPPQTIEALSRWSWPGNVRELENFIERGVILSQGPVLRLPLGELLLPEIESASSGTLEAQERAHIIRVLRETNGVIAGAKGAAARLGLKRTTLNSKMQKLGISRKDL